MAKLNILVGLAGFLGFVSLTACSHGECNNIPQREAAATTAGLQNNQESVSQWNNSAETTLIFKDSGQKQCEKSVGIAIEKMKASLIKNKIQVLEFHTQSDGMMRMQVCGASQGQIHVFKIQKKQLKRALGLGFKLLKNQN